tara:strand:+ start:11062 stop:12801 length:1740 start_codon:yes stop_codon:yes gene_type:complete
MCGILGGNFEGFNYKSGVQALIHRGPDDQKLAHEKIILGFCRLSIIDLHSRSNQPMNSRDGRISIIFNGEIYGFKKIRNKLIDEGHEFDTKSDTEVILKSYIQWGSEFIDKIDGMFSIVIFDKNKNKLYLYRDRPGIKPIYYYNQKKHFAFSSELKGLVQMVGQKNLEIDNSSIYDFLTYSYIPSPKSIYKQIKKLPPSHRLVYDISNKTIESIEDYWNFVPTQENSLTIDEASNKLKELVDESVKSQMISDVPLGFLLSGGLDSSIVTTSASNLTSQKIQTFTISFDESQKSEEKYASIIAKKNNTKHRVFSLSSDLTKRLMSNLSNWYDEPHSDTSAVPTFLVSHISKKYVTVVLTGDGGDELFGGYNRHKNKNRLNYILSKYSNIKSFLIKFRDTFCLHTPPYRLINSILRFFLDDLELHTKRVGVGGMIKEEKLKYRKYLEIEEDYDDYWYFRKNWLPELSYRNRIRYLDFKTYMHEAVLAKVDRTSMSVSLEARVPLLSRNLIEFMFSLPEKVVFHRKELKGLVKYSYKGVLPEIILSKKKQGFSVSSEATKSNIPLGINILKKYYSQFLTFLN